MTEIPHDLYYLLSLTLAHNNFDRQQAATQYSKVEFINLQN